MRRPRTILHVDMDAFFASVEVLDDPGLRGRPVIVGGTGGRGVVASASYEARAYGVHAAMPMVTARRACPHAVVLPGRHARYGEVSRQVLAVCERFTPLVEPLSLDEAFLDVSGALARTTPDAVARSLRSAVRDETRLDCSVGGGPSKLVAKLATEQAKPTATPAGAVPGAGVVLVTSDQVEAFLRPLPVGALWGVGPAMLARLARMGIATVGDLADAPLDVLGTTLGDAGRALGQLARGQDDREVVADRRPKSIGQEETFAADRFGFDELAPILRRQCDAVAARLRAAGVGARTVTIKVRYSDFRTITRSATLDSPTDASRDVREAAERLLRAVPLAAGVRLLGVSGAGLVEGAPRQLRLDEAGDPGGSVDRVVDEIRARWGSGAIGPARRPPPRGGPWG